MVIISNYDPLKRKIRNEEKYPVLFFVFPYVYVSVNNSNYLMALYILDKILNYWIEVVYFCHIKDIMSEMTLSM